MPVTRIDFPIDKLTSPNTEEEIQRKLAQERARLASMMGLDSGPVRHFQRPAERAFTAEERGKVTILFGGLTWKHERVIQAVFEGCGYRCEIMPVPNVSAFQLGKEYGNNGQCNPTYFTVGNLVQYLQTPRARARLTQAGDHQQLHLLHRRLLRAVPLRHVRSGVSPGVAERRLRWLPRAALPAERRREGCVGRSRAEVHRRLRHGHVQCAESRRHHERDDLSDPSVRGGKGQDRRGLPASRWTSSARMLRERKPFEDHEDLPEWMAKKIRANKGKKWEVWVNSLVKVREQLYGEPYKDALSAVRDRAGDHRGRPSAGEAGGEDHRRVLGADHRRRRQLPHVRVPGARRRAGAGGADRHLGDVHDVPGEGARRGASVRWMLRTRMCSGTSFTKRR